VKPNLRADRVGKELFESVEAERDAWAKSHPDVDLQSGVIHEDLRLKLKKSLITGMGSLMRREL
jgi:hypothetical protein